MSVAAINGDFISYPAAIIVMIEITVTNDPGPRASWICWHQQIGGLYV